MKLIVAFIVGLIPGVLLGVLVLLFNPFASVSEPARAPSEALVLPVAGSGTALVMQNTTGYPWVRAQPASAAKPEIYGMRSAVSVLLSSVDDGLAEQIDTEEEARSTVAYITRVHALNQAGRPLFGQLVDESMWHVVLPGQGSFVVFGQDNLWGFARELLMPFLKGESWRGKLSFTTSIGPGNERASVFGVSGVYKDLVGSARLDQTIRAISPKTGVTDSSGMLYVTFATE